MGWNEPDKGKDPWGGKNEPPDLDEALKRLQAKLRSLLSSRLKTNANEPETNPPFWLPAAAVFSILFLLWFLSGIFICGPAEQAAVLRFGRYVHTVGPGPHWIPRFIESKIQVNVDRVSDYSYSAKMLTQDENLVSVSVAVQYKIADLKSYLFNISDPEESLRQATSSALRQVVGTTTLDQIITAGREAWGINVQDSLIKILDAYGAGITIVNVSPQPARAPENVQDAFDDAIKAQEDEKRFREQAEAYAAKVVPIAQGNAKRIEAEAEADAARSILRAKGDVAEFLSLLPIWTASPKVTSERLYLNAMETILSKTSKIIVDTKTNNMLYLPIDKRNKEEILPPQLLPEQLASTQQNDQNSDEDSSTTADNRPFVRPVTRPGRNR